MVKIKKTLLKIKYNIIKKLKKNYYEYIYKIKKKILNLINIKIIIIYNKMEMYKLTMDEIE